VHAAHGYLLNSFLSPYANLRTDEYGGSTENRTRLVAEIVQGIREFCGVDFAIIVRISADEYLELAGKPDQGIKLEEGVAIAKLLEAAGADALDISSGIYETMNSAWEPFAYEEGWKSHLAARVKAAVGIPVIGASVYRNPDFCEQLLQDGKLDFVGSARAHFADPFWSRKAEQGETASIRRCISCLACMESLVAADETGGPATCAINPRTGRETVSIPADGDGRLVVVMGAGPAGLEAAVAAAERGCRVILFEKKDVIGGQLNLASKPPGKDKVNWLIDFYQNRIDTLGIDLRLDTWPKSVDVAALNPAAVIIATGSEPVLPRAITGLDGANVYTPPAILTGEVDLSGKKVCVVGSGMTGIETTELLATQGCQLSLFEMLKDIGPGVYFQNMMDIMPKLGARGVQFFPEHRLLGIEGNVARFEKADGSTYEDTFEAFVISLGTRPELNCGDDIRAYFPEAFTVGDSSKPGRIVNATTDGWLAVKDLQLA
jgi:NADPH-dependent 2,4-dienoyl-CoA reductase/sulfur reductase-like enzyme